MYDKQSSLIDSVRSLRIRSIRDQKQEFWIQGVRQLVRAFDAGVTFKLSVECEALNRHGLAQKLIRRLTQRGVPKVRVSPEVFRQISTEKHASGVGAIVEQPWIKPSEANPDAGLCWLAADSIRSAGNLGTLLRTAEAIGAAGLWAIADRCGNSRIDPFDPACIRATMGGLFKLKFVHSPLRDFIHWTKSNRVSVIGLDGDAKRSWCDISYPKRVALIVGDERHGISNPLRNACSIFARLPMDGSADSLNVAVAGGIAMYEMLRRRIRDGDSIR